MALESDLPSMMHSLARAAAGDLRPPNELLSWRIESIYLD
jgi:hypothetical protein